MAISREFSAEGLKGVRLPGSANALADIGVETRSGIVCDLEFSFNIDKKRFRFVLRSDSTESRNLSRLFCSWKIVTLWSLKNPYLLETISVGYTDTVRHARDYKVNYVVATSAFYIELCQQVVVKGFNKD